MARSRRIITEDNEVIYEGLSRSQQKRDVEALQKAGERLVELPERQLKGLEVPEQLLEAVMLARRIKERSALRRQKQYIGRLMRELDVEALLEGLARLEQGHQADSDLLHRLEQWRERLISEGDTALDALLGEYPQADRPALRSLARDAAREKAEGAAPRRYRELFKVLKGLMG